MIEIPANAEVECVDGSCGRSTYIIINPTTKQVTHFVVKESRIPFTERLVSIDQVAETTSDQIRLLCSQDDLATFQPFIETEYIRIARPDYEAYPVLIWPYAVPETNEWIPVERERIPPGELAVHRGAQVEATDGQVGRVDEFLVDPTSGDITHIVLREGHLWEEKELTIPVSGIEHIEEDTVHLKLDKQSIEMLPAVPIRRRYNWAYVMDVELIVSAFDEEGRADEVLQILKQLDKEDIVEILDSAVIIKNQDGKTSLKEGEDVDVKHVAFFGAVSGGLIGLLGGPAGVIVGAAAGAATGGIAANQIDMGFSDEMLQKLQESLQPGSSAIMALIEHKFSERVIEALADFGGQRIQQVLTDEIVTQLIAAAETEADDETYALNYP